MMIDYAFFDFGGVMLPEGNFSLKHQLGKIFHCNDTEILASNFNKLRPSFRNGYINEVDFLQHFFSILGKNDYNKIALNELWDRMLNNYCSYNTKLLELIGRLRSKGIKCFILSDTYPPLKERLSQKKMYKGFDNIFLSCDLHISKKDTVLGKSNIFTYMKDLGFNPERSIFIDDRKENCEIAKFNNFYAIQYFTNIELEISLQQIIY